jgi:hypothetical protein
VAVKSESESESESEVRMSMLTAKAPGREGIAKNLRKTLRLGGKTHTHSHARFTDNLPTGRQADNG